MTLRVASQAELHITAHAIERFQQRVENLTEDEVRQRLSSPVIAKAAEIGCTAVILPSGHRVALAGHTVVTVYPRRAVKRRRFGRREREE